MPPRGEGGGKSAKECNWVLVKISSFCVWLWEQKWRLMPREMWCWEVREEQRDHPDEQKNHSVWNNDSRRTSLQKRASHQRSHVTEDHTREAGHAGDWELAWPRLLAHPWSSDVTGAEVPSRNETSF